MKKSGKTINGIRFQKTPGGYRCELLAGKSIVLIPTACRGWVARYQIESEGGKYARVLYETGGRTQSEALRELTNSIYEH